MPWRNLQTEMLPRYSLHVLLKRQERDDIPQKS